jgi:hypothetical protein
MVDARGWRLVAAVVALALALAYVLVVAVAARPLIYVWVVGASAATILLPILGVAAAAVTLAVRDPGLIAPYPLATVPITAGVVAVGLHWFLGRPMGRLGRPAGVLLAFAAVTLLSLFLGMRHGIPTTPAVVAWVNLGLGFAAYLIVGVAAPRSRAVGLIGAIALVSLIAPGSSVSTRLAYDIPGRLIGPTHGANVLGTLMAMTMAFGLVLTVSHPRVRERLMGLTAVLVSAPVLFFTFSRSAILALLGGLLVAAAASSRRRAFGLVFAVAVAGFLILPWFLGERLTVSAGNNSTAAQELLAESDTLRVRAWLAGVRMAIAHPLAGVGFGGYDTYKSRYGGPPELTTAHNDTIRFFAETGVIGGGLAVAFVLLAAWSGWKRRADRVSLATLAMFVTFIIATQFNAQLYYIEASLLFWVAAAWMTCELVPTETDAAADPLPTGVGRS